MNKIAGSIAILIAVVLIAIELKFKDMILQWFHVKNMLPCSCGCRDNHWDVKDTINGMVCEASIVCDNCGKEVNYWAYGSTQFPEKYTELLRQKFYTVVQFCNLKQRYKDWKFARQLQSNKEGF